MNERAGFIFLTGGTGHTGSRVAARLLADGWRVRCLVHDPGNRAHLPASDRLEILQGDIEAPEGWAPGLRGAAACIHLAHIGFAQLVAGACGAAGVGRLIAMSSTRRFTRFPEDSAARVIAGEAALEASPLDFTILRPSMIYGGDRDNNVEKLVRWLRRRSWFPLVRGGANMVQPIFVGDVVAAVAIALSNPAETSRRALTIAGPEPMTQRAMIEQIGAAIGRPPLFVPVPYLIALSAVACVEAATGARYLTRAQLRRQLEDKNFDISEARDALKGWSPRPFNDGLRLKLAHQA